MEWFNETNGFFMNQHKKLLFIFSPMRLKRRKGEVRINYHREPGVNDDYILTPQAQDWCEDGSNDSSCEYGGQDVPFMEGLVDTPGVIAVFSGHDHGDTWCYKWDSLLAGITFRGNGLNLCLGQHSGYGGYGN
ncbi:uncharacterized protein N7498_004499 [Penicillium cinerascens]|uniref:Calcineurin-like phosphoesterase domain-containing protein n=1 Tax=Penicillium cinerascens TaxID=70096 RepID=A0A9W9MLY3_9EURO|nr:uncharacterized protein N7498_004499 [Penicillium cinerascens]KAJ5203620.1 hypothetical protein N7498_004499 [Penicillium cinerascens]